MRMLNRNGHCSNIRSDRFCLIINYQSGNYVIQQILWINSLLDNILARYRIAILRP